MLAKNPLAIRLTFNKRYRLKSANNMLSSVTKAADSAKRIQKPKSHNPCRLASLA
jgi:hypothetical protein